MAYFSNGSEGEFYEANICAHCVHGPDVEDGCAVWLVHLMFNYEQNTNPDLATTLELLIPRANLPGYNEFCTMFHPVSPEYADLKDRYQEWLKGRNKD